MLRWKDMLKTDYWRMAQFLFDVQQKNRLKQKGMLKRFTIDCVGVQHTLEDMRAEKAQKHTELKNKKGEQMNMICGF